MVENPGNIIQRKIERMEYLNKRPTLQIFHQQAVVQLTEIKAASQAMFIAEICSEVPDNLE